MSNFHIEDSFDDQVRELVGDVNVTAEQVMAQLELYKGTLDDVINSFTDEEINALDEDKYADFLKTEVVRDVTAIAHGASAADVLAAYIPPPLPLTRAVREVITIDDSDSDSDSEDDSLEVSDNDAPGMNGYHSDDGFVEPDEEDVGDVDSVFDPEEDGEKRLEEGGEGVAHVGDGEVKEMRKRVRTDRYTPVQKMFRSESVCRQGPSEKGTKIKFESDSEDEN